MSDVSIIPLSIEEREQYDPVKYLLTNAEKTHIPLVYKNKDIDKNSNHPLVVIVCGPGGVGKDTVTKPLYQKKFIQKVQTATSRPRRVNENEPEDYYLWMRQKRDDESADEYVANLISEYELIEHDNFNGFVYGIPLANLQKSLVDGVPLLVITTKGVRNLLHKLRGEAHIVTVFVVPESYEQLYKRIAHRENPEQRLKIAVNEIKIAPELANFYLYNPIEHEGQSGLAAVQDSLYKLILTLSGRA